MEAKSFDQHPRDHDNAAKSFDQGPGAPDQYDWLYPWIFPAAIVIALVWGLLQHR